MIVERMLAVHSQEQVIEYDSNFVLIPLDVTMVRRSNITAPVVSFLAKEDILAQGASRMPVIFRVLGEGDKLAEDDESYLWDYWKTLELKGSLLHIFAKSVAGGQVTGRWGIG